MATKTNKGELQQLLSVSKYKIQDSDGVWHPFTVPTLKDMAAFEARHGSVISILDSSMDVMHTLCWLGIRREGLSKDQIKQEDWAYSYDDVGDMFSLKELEHIRKILNGIIVDAGWADEETASADPTKEGENEAANQETSPPEPGEDLPPSSEDTAE